MKEEEWLFSEQGILKQRTDGSWGLCFMEGEGFGVSVSDALKHFRGKEVRITIELERD